MVTPQAIDRDVFALARRGGEIEVQALHVRDGRVTGAQGFGFSEVSLDDGEVMSSFLGQYYGAEEGREIPAEVLTPLPVDDDGALDALFAERTGRRVALRTPRRGRLFELLATARANAELGLKQRLEARESLDAACAELQQALGLRRLPRHIEGYDVSTFAGTLTVASRVVFRDGQPSKPDFRRYRIRDAAPDDDLACLREVFARRLARAESEPLPDLMLVDGGKGQLAVLSAALADAGLETDAISLAKERDAESPSPRVRRSGGLKSERDLPSRAPRSGHAPGELARPADAAAHPRRVAPLRDRVPARAALQGGPGLDPRGDPGDRAGQAPGAAAGARVAAGGAQREPGKARRRLRHLRA